MNLPLSTIIYKGEYGYACYSMPYLSFDMLCYGYPFEGVIGI